MALLAHPGQQGAGPPYRGSASQVMLAGHRSFANGAHSPPLARATAPPYTPAFCFACSRMCWSQTPPGNSIDPGATPFTRIRSLAYIAACVVV
jgi:hypothetical protein